MTIETFGLVLAGGLARRMGGGDKALIRIGNETILERALARLTPQVSGVVQCVPLPGPGTYALTGWGRGTGTMVTAGDLAQLHWEFRKNGGEDCTGGLLDASGTTTLSNSTSWSRPQTPVSIAVAEQDWTPYSTIAVTLVAVENGASGAPTNAWFDGVTLGSCEEPGQVFLSLGEG